ncbi:Large neutral amino acids transporter small [Fasciola gigantica]|uniref:Large neutral amino acids transporter small n=1 Tax=Fasciola gigantica TaxID=46835 RepID=A0A504YVK6_FASGI|nr:Large neutral amino acids transporter small [Fasciola gigantica]
MSMSVCPDTNFRLYKTGVHRPNFAVVIFSKTITFFLMDLGLKLESVPEKSKTSSDSEKSKDSKQKIGVLSGINILVGIIIGSGIFVSPAGILSSTKSIGLSLVMWVATGVFSILGACVYAELGILLPKNGGDYIYIHHVIGPAAAFVTLWIIYFILSGAGLAANALVFAVYLLRPIYGDDTCEIPIRVVRLAALVGLLFLYMGNCYQLRFASALSAVFTFCKLAALATVIILGAIALIRGSTSSFENPFEGSTTSPGDLAIAFYHGYWAFSGWACINNLTSEVRNPARNLPIIIIVSLIIVTVIYLLANIAYLAVLSPYELMTSNIISNAVAETFAVRTMGPVAFLMPLCVGISVFGSVSGGILSSSRVGQAASLEGHLPSVFSMLHIKQQSPIPSVLGLVFLSVYFVFSEDTSRLIELTGFAFIIVTAMTTCCHIHIRRTTKVKSEFSIPMWISWVYLIITILIGCLTIQLNPWDALISLALMLVSLPLYIICIALERNSFTFRRLLRESLVPTYVTFDCFWAIRFSQNSFD